jgi:hypothetical protein
VSGGEGGVRGACAIVAAWQLPRRMWQGMQQVALQQEMLVT